VQQSGFRFIQDLFGAVGRRDKFGSDPQMSEPYVAIDRLLKSCHLLLTDLGNGACVDDIIWPADLSKKGLSESYGVMINYWYELSQIGSRHEAFAQHAQVAMSDDVSAMLASKLSVIKGAFA